MTEKESFFESILDQIPGEIVVLDKQYRYVYVNPKAIADAELRKWIIGKTDHEYCKLKGLSTEFADQRIIVFNQVIEEDREVELLEKIVSKDGEVKYHIRRVLPFRNGAGECTHFLGYGFDFTEQQKVKEELVESRNFIFQVLDSSPHLIFVKDYDGRLVLANLALCNLFGLTLQDLVNQSKEVLHNNAEDILHNSRIDKEVLDSGFPIRIEEVFTRNNGQISYFETVKVPFLGLNNEKLVLAICTDITDRKKNEELLKIGAQRVIIAQELTKAGDWEVNFETNTVSWSIGMYPIWERDIMLGPPSVDELGSFVHPDDSERVMDAIFLLKNANDKANLTYRIAVPSGEKTVITVAMPFCDNKGKVIRIFGTVIDITEQKKTEEIFRLNEQRLNEAQELANSGSYEFELSTRQVNWSRGCFLIWKRPFELGAPTYEEFEATVHPDDREAVRQKNETLSKREDTYTVFYRIVCPDGEVKSLKVITKLQKNNKNELEKIFGTLTDISERVISDEKMKLNEQRLLEAQQLANLGSWQLDITSGKSEWSIGTHLIWDIDLDAAPLTFNELMNTIIEEDRKYVSEVIKAAISSNENFNVEYRIQTVKGNLKIVNGRGRIQTDSKGVPVLMFGSVLDITDRKKEEAELIAAKHQAEDSVRAKEYFLANVGHELRTPLNGVLGMARLLQKTELSITQRNYIDLLSTTAGNLLVIINDILDIAKIDSGTLTFEKVNFDPFQVAETAIQIHMYKAEEKDLILRHLNEGVAIPSLNGDPYRLNQILLNLLSNAVKFTSRGEIVLSQRIKEEEGDTLWVEFSVKDTGLGIPLEKQNSIFDSFTQLNPETANIAGGTGLGLAISKNLVEKQGGVIMVESTLGVGSVFKFTIPYQRSIATDIEPNDRSVFAVSQLGPLRVLLAEDNRVNQFIVEAMLQDWGLNVDVASNGREAVELFNKRHYDLILMDIQMPEVDGVEATYLIRASQDKTKAKVPIVALTANTTKQAQRQFMTAGMNDFLVKPFKEESLYKKIINLFAGKSNFTMPIKKRFPIRKRPVPVGDSLYNLSFLTRDARDNVDFLKRMLSIFIETIPPIVMRMNEHFEKGEMDAIANLAHKIKPTIDGAGIVSLKEIVRNIENYRDKKRSPDQLKSDVARISQVLDAVIAGFKVELENLEKESTT